MALKREVDDAQIRSFGFVMTTALVVISGMMIFKAGTVPFKALPTLIVAALFFFTTIRFPKLLIPLERWWMLFAEKLSVVSTFLIMVLTFFLVLTPIAVVARLLKKDPLQLRLEPSRESYWNPVEQDGPASRPFTPY